MTTSEDASPRGSNSRASYTEASALIVQNQPESEILKLVRTSTLGLAGFAILYLLFFALYVAFPYLRPGDSLVSAMKHTTARNGNLFKTAKGDHLHVMAFGYSKMLAGFIPSVFDQQLADAGFKSVESYNFGLPGDSRFVADLEAMAAHGTAPDIALLTFPWPAQPAPGASFFHFINDDQEAMNQLFPFRHLPRDFFIFTIESHGLRTMRPLYRQNQQSVEQVYKDRGYYFIARQSHYANDELPPDFHQPTDKPDSLSPRVVTLGPVYQQLATVLAEHKIRCLFIPSYFREGEFAAPPPVNAATAAILAGQPNIAIAGPDYWLYPNRLFSDPTHANRSGAGTYTRAIAALVANWLKR